MIKRWFAMIFALGTLSIALPAHALFSCTVSATGVNFGTYDPFSAAARTGNANVSVNCAGSLLSVAIYTVSLSAGSGTYAERTMVSGSNRVRYNLYRDTNYLLRLGDGTLGTVTLTDSLTLHVSPLVKSHTIYGRMPALQTDVRPGTYSDTLVVSVAF